MKNYLRSLSHSFLMKNIDDLKQYLKIIPYYSLAKCNANICCNCHKEWPSFSWWYQIARIYTSMLEFQFNWNILFHLPRYFFLCALMKRFLYFVTRFSIFYFGTFGKSYLPISIFVGRGIYFLVCKGKGRISFWWILKPKCVVFNSTILLGSWIWNESSLICLSAYINHPPWFNGASALNCISGKFDNGLQLASYGTAINQIIFGMG